MDGIFVGIACYNRPDGLQDTVRCLRQQTHQNWTALICDNASPDPRVQQIAEQAVAEDARFRYQRHPRNLGASENFRYSAQQSDQPFFMWASDDDLWHPDFMKTNLQCLSESPSAQLAFCSVQVINQFGRVLFSCDPFSRLSSTGDRRADLVRYLDEPEKAGKANLFYSLFRTSALQSVVAACWDAAHEDPCGADNVFVFAFLCRHAMVAHDALHLSKRQPTTKKRKIHWRHPRSYRAVKPQDLESYIARHRAVASSSEFAELADSIIRRRQSERYLYRIPVVHRWLPDHSRIQSRGTKSVSSN